MLRFLAQMALAVLANAVGLLVASLVVPGFSMQPVGFVIAVVIFSVLQGVLSPFMLSMSLRYMPAIRGGVALVTTLVSLVLTNWLTDGLNISGLTAWVLGPFVVWLAVLLAAVVLPLFLFKQLLSDRPRRQSTITGA
ncbi:phage holin family protein [Ornithinimicrobium ciconiae]|uniref:Phage holin family protein n=1 Tax=Ornithinimicrobium ciconiae TaxID=2594265 RepID=A0A516G9K8_9MICO|nr:phage holin family protein [Ornithinimicrobium ciconiae]QDO88175.1 phage holin family protein [Ornithinimicrobium ciconiae]